MRGLLRPAPSLLPADLQRPPCRTRPASLAGKRASHVLHIWWEPALLNGQATQEAARIAGSPVIGHGVAQLVVLSRPDCSSANTAGQPACSSSPERSSLVGTEEPAPQGDLGMRARKAGAGSYLPYFAAAWRRAMLALMHSTMSTTRTPVTAVTQAADESKGTSQPYPYLD